MAGVFSGCQIVLDLTASVPFKKKVEIKKKIIENGGIVSFIVTKKSTYVVGNDPEKYDVSYKCQMAAKYRIPVVSPEFVWNAIKMGKLPNTDDYIIGGRSKKSDFKSGKITANLPNIAEKKKTKSLFFIKGTKVWKFGKNDAPFFDEATFEIAKYATFQGYDKTSESQVFYVLELHAADVTSKNAENREFKFRVFTHYGCLQEVQEGKPGTQECRYAENAAMALAIYGQLHKDLSNPTRKMMCVHGCLPRSIGSIKLQKMVSEMLVDDGALAPSVVDLIEHIWREATGEVEEMIATPVRDIKVEQIEKAEAIMLQLREALDKSSSVYKLLTDFYNTLKHTSEHPQNTTVTKAWLAKKQDLCQLIKDMVSVNEATNWSVRSSVKVKYQALRCRFGHLETCSRQYKLVKDLVTSSVIGDINIEIKSIFEVQRPIEDNSFLQEMANKSLLFHSSTVENFVGIFSRGLLLPKIVVDDFGGTRTDAGMLGSGVYFTSAASTSAKYSHPSRTKGTRLMLVNEVALGHCLDVFEHNTDLKQPPEGYDSVHGVRKQDGIHSQFTDDEYVVYSLSQQRIKYLVEFALDGDKFTNLTLSESETDMEDMSSGIAAIDLRDVQDIEDPLIKVKAGLICDTHESAVILRGVHIRARLVDLAAEVIVMQEYYNNLSVAVEAKFIFPLDDMAAVCGFEAFINGKHIIGEVKEKESAHREYKQAISEGHGAYLMDRDKETPDVFTVSVGNLPPHACVLIKITYITELQVEGEVINFRLPGSVAPWKENSAKKDTTQTELDIYDVVVDKTTVQVSIDMPFNINSLECPTHKLRIKKTATKAVVEMKEGQTFEDGFQLLIGLAEIHVPRMWVESHPVKSDHQACMLTFYPEFEAGEQAELEVVFLLDLSNSMKGQALEDAKKILLLILNKLPSHAVFNIIVFGTAYRELFAVSEANSPGNTGRAVQFIKNCMANMGNTEIFRPLHSNYLLSSESCMKNIFLISDGHINNEDIVLNAALTNAAQTRLFTFGVSSTSNVHLLRSLARVGGGAFEFFDRKAKSKWENKVKGQLSKAAQPGLTSVSVEWRQFDEDPSILPQAPQQITALFNGSRQVIYGYVPNCTMATLKAVVGGQEVCTVVSTSDLSITRGLTVHRLTARAIIRDWEDGMLSSDRTRHEIIKMSLKPYIIDLSTEYSIVTQLTSFVAVEKRDEDERAGKWTASGPTIKELVAQEVVDMLPYISWEQDEKATKEEEYEDSTEKIEDWGNDSFMTEESEEEESEWESEEESEEEMGMQLFCDPVVELGLDHTQQSVLTAPAPPPPSSLLRAQEEEPIPKKLKHSPAENMIQITSPLQPASTKAEDQKPKAPPQQLVQQQKQFAQNLHMVMDCRTTSLPRRASPLPPLTRERKPLPQQAPQGSPLPPQASPLPQTSQLPPPLPPQGSPLPPASQLHPPQGSPPPSQASPLRQTSQLPPPLPSQGSPQASQLPPPVPPRGSPKASPLPQVSQLPPRPQASQLPPPPQASQLPPPPPPQVSQLLPPPPQRGSPQASQGSPQASPQASQLISPLPPASSTPWRKCGQILPEKEKEPLIKYETSFASTEANCSGKAFAHNDNESSHLFGPQLQESVPAVSFGSWSQQSKVPETTGFSFGGSEPQKSQSTLPSNNYYSTPIESQSPLECAELIVNDINIAKKKKYVAKTKGKESEIPLSYGYYSRVVTERPIKFCRKASEQLGRMGWAQLGLISELQMETGAQKAKVHGTGTRLRFSDLGTLINQQHSKGFWDLQEQLEKVLGFDIKSFKNILFTAGLQSLGPVVTKEVIHLLATMIVLLSIYELFFPERFPLNLDAFNLSWSVVKEIEKEFKNQYVDIKLRLAANNVSDSQVDQIIEALQKGLRFCEDTDKRYPLIYSTLELGSSWISVSAKLLGVCA